MRLLLLVPTLLLTCFLIKPAAAVVNQINGTVIPLQTAATCPFALDKCIQTSLNFGEGINPPYASPTLPGFLDAILDANTGPETFFIPQSAGKFIKVTFRLLQEGATFESIFSATVRCIVVCSAL